MQNLPKFRKIAQIRYSAAVQNIREKKFIWPAFCLLAVLIIYGRTLLGDFVFDDRGIVEHRALLSDLNKFDRVLMMPYWTEAAGLYRPVVLASYALNYVLAGSDPFGFHLVNLLFYAAGVFLIAEILKSLFKNNALAYLTATLFLVLPIHTEAVANIIGRAEILALFFSLLAFRELLKEKIAWRRAGFWIFLALGSKETAVAAMPISILIIYLKEKEFFSMPIMRKYGKAFSAMLAGGAFYFVLRFLVLGKTYFLKAATSIVENPLQFVSVKERIATALGVLVMYLEKTFWPLNLCSDYSYNQLAIIKGFLNPAVIIGVLIIIFFCSAIFIFLKRAPVLALASAVFIFSYLPIANLIFPTGTIAGERLMFYPSLGLCLLSAWLMLALPKKFYLPLILILLVFYGYLSFRRAGDWMTEKKLFASAAECAPNSVLSQSNLGADYYLSNDLDNAKKALLKAESIYDSYPKGVNNLGLVYWKQGDRETAKKYFLRALSFDFPYYGAYENLALMAIEEKNRPEAEKWLMEFYSGDKAAADNYIEKYLQNSGF
ncbi:MAG: tetratricopeptide repeat protein [bacterium]